MTGPHPARLHVLLARDATTAVILRRGPSRHTALVGWDRRTDRFTVGQWFYGRVYERRSDLSPDGRHLVYFAMNARWDARARGSWTAISKAPYLKALTLLAKGEHDGRHHAVRTFERRISDRWALRKLACETLTRPIGKGCYYDEHALVDDRTGRTLAYPGWEWAEVDGGRLVWAEAGGLYTGRVERDGLRSTRLLYDFNPLRSERLAAPY